MNDQEKSKEQLIEELQALRKRLLALEDEIHAGHEQAEPEPSHSSDKAEEALRESEARLSAILEQLPVAVGVHNRQDITMRRQTEKELRESEEKLRSILRVAPVGIGLTVDRVILEANEHLCTMTGYEREELINAPGRMLYPSDEEYEWVGKEKYRQIEEKGTGTVETIWRKKDGALINVLLSSTPLELSDPSSGVTFTALDITARKTAEEALRRREEEFRALVENAPDVISLFDRNLRRIYVNSQVRKITGQEVSSMLGKSLTEAGYPESFAQPLNAALQKVFTTGSEETVELDYKAPKGWIWVQIRCAPLRDVDGSVELVMSIGRDITDRKRAEEALREALAKAEAGDQMLSALMANVPEGITICDSSGRLQMVSRHGEELLGGPHSGKSIKEVANDWAIYQPDGQTVMPVEELPLSRALKGQTVQDVELMVVNSSERKLPLLCNAAPIRDTDGQVVGGILVWRDITDRKRMEEALRESEERLSMALSAAKAGAWSWNIQTGAIVCSPETYELYGLDPAHGPPAYSDWESCVHPDDISYTNQVIKDAVERRTPEYRAEFRVIHPNLGIRWLLWVGRVEYASDETPLRMLGIDLDITERKRMEEELRRSRDELDARVQERTAELRVSNKALREHAAKLERLNEELQDFAFVAAHDLQEPLRKIQTFTDMVVNRCQPALDSTGREYLERVIRSAARMRDLLQDLLQFSRVATKPEPFKPVDVTRVVREAVESLEEDFSESGALIEIEEMPPVQADEILLLRLFEDLISNALKFRRADEAPRIKVFAKEKGGRCEIFVEDNGMGFDPQYAERIFRPLQRLHDRGEYDGTGMGLAICRKIAEWHGGGIRAESEPGKGSRFIVTLPVSVHIMENA